MTPEDIKKFKEETADPVMNKVLEKVELKEGQVIIDGIRITVSDGRSYGFDTLFQLKGLTISNGKVVDFAEEFADVPMEEFLAVLSEYTVLGYGDFCAEDDQKPLEVHTTIRNAGDCTPIFEDLKGLEKIKYVNDSPEYEKMLREGLGIDVNDFVVEEATKMPKVEMAEDINTFAQKLVKTVRDKGYVLIVKNDGHYTEVSFYNMEHPEYEDHFGVSYSPKDFASSNNLVEYSVWCKITSSEIMQTSKEDLTNFIEHRDTLQHFVDLLNEQKLNYDVLEDESFYNALLKAMNTKNKGE